MVKKKDRAERTTFELEEDEKEETHLSLVEKEDEEKKIARLKMVENGSIQDARVFQLMYLEKCAIEATLQSQVRKNAYEARIQTLRQELQTILRQWEDAQKKSIRKISDVRREIEQDYGIYMKQWGYEEETGTLTRLPQEEAPVVDDEKDRGKLKEDSKKEATGGESGAG